MVAEKDPYRTPCELYRMYPTAHVVEEIRELCRREDKPIPHLERGNKDRKYLLVRESVYVNFLDWEEGLISYDEMVQRSRRRVEGVW